MQVFEEYAAFVNDKGLTLGGLLKSYADGVSDIDTDFAAIGLDLTAVTVTPPNQVEAPRKPDSEDAASDLALCVSSPFRDRTNSMNSPTHSPQRAAAKGLEGNRKGSPSSSSRSHRRQAGRLSTSRLTQSENAEEVGPSSLHGWQLHSSLSAKRRFL